MSVRYCLVLFGGCDAYARGSRANSVHATSPRFPIGNLTRRRCIKRRFQFRDYRTALAFANAVSVLAEEVWHHPELALGWGFCDVSLTTRKIGGLHESDLVMAALIDALASGPLDSAWLPPLPPPKRTKQ